MNYFQLRYFIAAADMLSFSEAAESEYTTQSTISKQIMNLENELGVKLFSRHNRRIALTPIGSELLEDAKNAVAHLDILKSHARYFLEENRTRLRIVSLPFMNQYGLSKGIKKHLEKHPELHLSVTEVEELEMMKLLFMNDGDIFLLRDSMYKGSDRKKIHVTSDELHLFVSKMHPLSQTSRISLTDLQNETFAFMHNYTSIYQLSCERLKQVGIDPKILLHSRLETILSTVSSGLAISLLPVKNSNTYKMSDMQMIPIEPPIRCDIVAMVSPLADPLIVKEVLFSLKKYAL